MTWLVIILAIVIVIVVWAISVYNSLVKSKNRCEEALSGIDVHLNKRYDLIPNLVETVKGYAKHEEKTLESVINARNACLGATTIDEKSKADGVLSSTLKNLFALSESYPDLKANVNFISLQESLNKIEEEILNARKYYNAAARSFNDKIMVFPSNLIASLSGFKKLSYVDVDDEKKENVKVSF